MKDLFEILQLVYIGEYTTQRDFSKEMFLSVGKVNTIIKEALDASYLQNDKGYKLTEKGLTLLKSYKVDNAIIFASSKGITVDNIKYPVGYLKIKNEMIIERLIKQLQEKDIKDISIVVGFQKERYEYLIDKYHVQLIYNPDFENYDRLTRIFQVAPIMKNTYLIESDMYFEKNVFRSYEMGSQFLSTRDPYTPLEKTVDITKDKLVRQYFHSKDEQSMKIQGVAFIDKTLSDIISKEIEVESQNLIYQYLNWKDLILEKNTEVPIYIRELDKKVLNQMSSIEKVETYDKNFLLYNMMDVENKVRSLWKTDIQEIEYVEVLKNGVSNISFLVIINHFKYVIKISKDIQELKEQNFIEYQVYEAIKSLNISDTLVLYDEASHIKITRYVDDVEVADLHDANIQKQVIETLKNLHDKNIKVNHRYNLESHIQKYIELAEENDAIFFTDFEAVKIKLKKIFKIIRNAAREEVLCHLEPITGNFLLTHKHLILVDWELSGMADPFLDLAFFIVSMRMEENHVLSTFEAYLKRKYTEHELIILYAYLAQVGFLWSLWSQYEQSKGVKFGTYSIEQYRYGRKYARKAVTAYHNMYREDDLS